MDSFFRGHLPDDLTNLLSRDGHYPIASGGFADIYRGMLQYNGQSMRVAIKAIKTYSGEDSATIFSKKQKRLRREIRVWRDLRHDNILPFLGTATGFSWFPAMVCPWVEHGCLTSYLGVHYQSLSGVKILSLLNNVASGIQYLHSRSIVHGDLSGSNVLIHDGGRPCITDFGLSMLLGELGGSTFATSFHARGTLRWTAPELLDLEVPAEEDMDEESPHVGPTTQSDVYSFGSVMLQILSGKVPYHYYRRDAQVLHAISKGKTPERPSIALVTECRWMFLQQCWTLVDPVHSRPLSEEIVKFTKGELVAHEESSCAGLQVRSSRWKALIRESEKAIDQYLVPGINMDLDILISCITFRVFSVVFLGVDSDMLAFGNMELVIVVTGALTDFYNNGQGKNTLPIEVQSILNEWLPPRQFPFSLDHILPAYEGLWRIVATVVVTCEDNETEDLRWVMLDFRDNPWDGQYRSSFGGRKSAAEITEEVVKGITLPFARTQKATTSTWPLSCIQYATRSAGPSPTVQEALKFAALLASKIIGRIGVHYRISDGSGSQVFPWKQRKIYEVGRAADHVSIKIAEH